MALLFFYVCVSKEASSVHGQGVLSGGQSVCHATRLPRASNLTPKSKGGIVGGNILLPSSSLLLSPHSLPFLLRAAFSQNPARTQICSIPHLLTQGSPIQCLFTVST